MSLVDKRRVYLSTYDTLAPSLLSTYHVPSTVLGTVRVSEVCETLLVHKRRHLEILEWSGLAVNWSSQLKWAMKVKWGEKSFPGRGEVS